MNNRKDTAFTVELLGLFILLIMVITIVASVFVLSRSHSLEARSLNEAVILAESAAEVSSTAPDNEALADRLYTMDNNTGHSVISRDSSDSSGSWNAIYASLKSASAKSDQYIICVTRSYPNGTPEERSDGGTYAEDTIVVYARNADDPEDIGLLEPSGLGEPIYTLVTGTYFGSDDYAKEGGRS
jgi:hypothetical protein